jgi:uncharacterized membrane protein YvbJ
MRIVIFVGLLILPFAAFSQDCKSMEAMVKLLLSPIPISDQSTVENLLKTFFSGYDKLLVRVSQIEDLNSAFRSEQGKVAIKAVATRPLDDTSKCPSNSDAYRGEMNGRVNFKAPYPNPPSIHTGLVELDTSQIAPSDSTRLNFEIISVDKNGFNYAFYTWCTTKIYSATASWIAVYP